MTLLLNRTVRHAVADDSVDPGRSMRRSTPLRADRSRRDRRILVVGGCVAALVVASALCVAVGSVAISPLALINASDPGHGVAVARMERGLLGLAVGAALGLAGALLQGLTRNPLADPSLLGLNAGASLAMVLGISFGVATLQGYIWLAFAGSAIVAVVVHGVASLGRDGATPMKIVVAGAAVSTALTSWTAAVLLTDRATMDSFRHWQVGTISGRDLDVLAVGLPFLAVGALLAAVGSRLLDALALGDDVARGLGRRTALDRVVVGVAVVLLAGGATALAGPIAFVGLLVPHAVRALVGPGHARVLPLSAVGGGLLVVLADTLGRLVARPSEVQVGIMCAVVGVPFFLWMLRRHRWGAL